MMDYHMVREHTDQIIRETLKIPQAVGNLDSTTALDLIEAIKLHLKCIKMEVTPPNLRTGDL